MLAVASILLACSRSYASRLHLDLRQMPHSPASNLPRRNFNSFQSSSWYIHQRSSNGLSFPKNTGVLSANRGFFRSSSTRASTTSSMKGADNLGTSKTLVNGSISRRRPICRASSITSVKSSHEGRPPLFLCFAPAGRLSFGKFAEQRPLRRPVVPLSSTRQSRSTIATPLSPVRGYERLGLS